MQNEKAISAWVEGKMKSLPAAYVYHNFGHSLYVRQKAVEIGRQEGIDPKEMDLLITAALWHDVGFIHLYDGHEEEGCKLAKQQLPGFGFSENDIDLICGLVMATKVPQSPTTKLEEMLADADLSYLGTSDVATQAHNLFLELQSLTPSLTGEAWINRQIGFLEDHRYFTACAKTLFEPGKQAYLNGLKKTLERTSDK